MALDLSVNLASKIHFFTTLEDSLILFIISTNVLIKSIPLHKKEIFHLKTS